MEIIREMNEKEFWNILEKVERINYIDTEILNNTNLSSYLKSLYILLEDYSYEWILKFEDIRI